MKNLKIFLLLFVILSASSLITSCKKDDDGNSNPFTPSGATVKTSVLGTITNINGYVVPGATVKLGTYTTVTDARGNFKFINADVPKDRMVLVASKDGYFNCVRAKKTQSGDANYINLLMEEKPVPVNVPGVAGGVVNIPGGAKITFPANAFFDAAGNVYTGTVKVFARHISPGDDNFESIVPGGDLTGLNLAGQTKSLYSFGMIEAILTDATGLNEIKIAPGKTAELKFPINSSQSSSAQSTIPLWHMNETTGIWKEEGEAVRTGNFFVGNVSHFSTWNCDYPGERTNLQGKVVDCNNNPVAGIVVTINGFMNVTTDNSGAFTSWAPAGFTIECQALMIYNSILASDSPVQTITAVANVLNIIPPIVIPCATRIIGNVKTCDQANFSPAIIYCSWNGGNKLEFSPAGNYNLYVPPNTSINLIASVIGISGDQIVQSGSAGTTNQVPDILMCNSNTPISLNQISFTHFIDSVGANPLFATTYLCNITSRIAEFDDWDGNGVYEHIYLWAEGKTFPGNLDFDFEIDMTTEVNGYYPLALPTANFIHIYITSTSFLDISGGDTTGISPITTNRVTITDYGSPGSPIIGTFEFDNLEGNVTNGQFSISRYQ